MNKITVTGQLTLTGGQLTAKPTYVAPAGGKEMWTWGEGTNGKLGLGDTAINRSSPVQIGALTDWASTSSGSNHNHAIKTDGSLWAWGAGASGRAGFGDIAARSSPVQIGALTNWASVAAGNAHSFAIKTDGTLWAWGDSSSDGELGDGTILDKSSPIQIGALVDWATVSAGDNHSLATKTDGTLWSWGSGAQGRLGLGDVINRSSPVQIGSLTTWASCGCSIGAETRSFAVKSDGTLWSWGSGSGGRLGLGDVINRSSPTQVGILSDWASVSAGDAHSLATKINGTIWSWGTNGSGRLGDGTTTNRNSPVQIGALTDWASVSAGDVHSTALKSDGSLWVWGANSLGQLGQGNTTIYSSPVQIGSETSWASIGDWDHSLALKTP